MPSHKKKNKGFRKPKKTATRRSSRLKTSQDEAVNIKIEVEETCSLDEKKDVKTLVQAHLNDQPIKIHSDALLEVWYKPDLMLGVPESYVNLHYISPITFESTENVAMFDLFEKILKNLMIEQLDPLCFAELNFKISPGLKGLWIKAIGFNEKLPTLLKDITSYMILCWNLLNEDLFNLVKKENLQIYHSKIMDPKKLVKDLRHSLTILYYWSNAEMYAALSNIEFHQFQDFVKHFTDHMYVQWFVQGNMERADVIDAALECIEILNCRPLPPNTMPQHSMNEIPRGLHCCRVRSFDSEQLQTFVTNYYQFEDPSFKLAAMIDYLSMVMAKFLPRDNECDLLRGNFGMFGYAITGIVLEEDTVEDVDYRIEGFRNCFNLVFKKMNKDNLLDIKTCVITIKKDELDMIDRKEDEQANWTEIMTGKNCFNREARELEMMNKMTLEELRMWMMKFTMGEYDHHLRKLSVQIVGYDDPMDNSADMTQALDKGNDNSVEYPLKYLTRLSKDTKKTTRSMRDYYITDIEDFRRTLNILPWQNSSL